MRLESESLALLFDEIFITVAQCVAAETQRQRDDAASTTSLSSSIIPTFTSEVAHHLAEDLTALPVLRPPPDGEILMRLRWQNVLNEHPLLANQPLDAAFVSLAAGQIQQLVQESLQAQHSSTSSEVEENFDHNLNRSPYNQQEVTYSSGNMQFDDSETDTTDTSCRENGEAKIPGDEENPDEKRWMLIPAQEDVRSHRGFASSSTEKVPSPTLQKAQQRQQQSRMLAYQVVESDSDNDIIAKHSPLRAPFDSTATSSSAYAEAWNTPRKSTTQASENGDGYIAPWDLPISPMENLFRRGYGGLGQDNLADVIDLLEGDQKTLSEQDSFEDAQTAARKEEDEELYHKLHSSGEELPTVPIPVARCRYDLDGSESDKYRGDDDDSNYSAFVLSPMTSQVIPEIAAGAKHQRKDKSGATTISVTKKNKTAANSKKVQGVVTKAATVRKHQDARVSLDLLSPSRQTFVHQVDDNNSKDKQSKKKSLSRNNARDKNLVGLKKTLPSTVVATTGQSNSVPILLRSKKPSETGTKVAPNTAAVASSSLAPSIAKLQRLILSQQQRQRSQKDFVYRHKKKSKSSAAVTSVSATVSSSSFSSGPEHTRLLTFANTNNFDTTGYSQEVSRDLRALRQSLSSVKEMQSSLLHRAEQTLLSLRDSQTHRTFDPAAEELEGKLWSSEIQLLDDLPVPNEEAESTPPEFQAESQLPFDSIKSTSLDAMMWQSFSAHIQQYSKNYRSPASDSGFYSAVEDDEPCYIPPTQRSVMQSSLEKENSVIVRSKISSAKNAKQQQQQQQPHQQAVLGRKSSDSSARQTVLRQSLCRPLFGSAATPNHSSKAVTNAEVSSSTRKSSLSNNAHDKTSKRPASAPRGSIRSSN